LIHFYKRQIRKAQDGCDSRARELATSASQAQVGEVVDIMRVNVEKVLERDSKLSELDQRADNLQEGANQFQTQATRLKRKYWWQNMKMMGIIGVVVAVILLIIIISATSG